MTKRTRSGMAALAVLAVAAALAGASRGGRIPAAPEPELRPLPVAVMPLEASRSIDIQHVHAGILRSARSSELGFERSGVVTRLLADEGDAVQAGQLLAELDAAQLLARRDQLRAQLDRATAVLDELLAGPRREQIAAARAEVQQLRAESQLAAATQQRAESLRSKRVISEQDYDRDTYGAEAARARLAAAERRLEELEAGTRSEQVRAQRGAVDELHAAIRQLDADLDDARLVAPYAGTVAARHLDEGAVIAAGTAVFRLIDSRRIEAWIGLPPDVVDRLEIGQTHRLAVQGCDVEGTLQRKLPELDSATRTRTAIWQLPEAAPERWTSGSIVRIAIHGRLDAEGFWVPLAALSPRDRGLWALMAVVPDAETGSLRVESRDVEILHEDEQRAFVRGAVSAGERIVACGVHRLTPGQAVSAQPPEA